MMSGSDATYEWIIPQSIDYIDSTIIHGFYRQLTHQQIIDDIARTIHEFIEFDYSGIPFNEYTFSDIKNELMFSAERCGSFLSPMFSAESLKFYMVLFPSIDTIRLELRLPAIARHQIKFHFTICIKELNVSVDEHVTFEAGFDNMTEIEFKQIGVSKISHLKQLTIEFKKQHPTKAHAISKSRRLPTLQYFWSITDRETLQAIANKEGFNNNKFVSSPQFAFGPFRWYLSIVPMKHNYYDKIYTFSVYLHLVSMPRGCGIDEIMVRCKSYFREREQSMIAHDVVFGHYHLKNKLLEVNENKLQSIKLFIQICIYEAYAVQFRNNGSPQSSTPRSIQKRQIIHNYIEHFISSKPQIVHLTPPRYYWMVNTNEIRTSGNSRNSMWGITSPLFRAQCLKWFLTLYSRNGQSMVITLTLASRPSLGLSICACCTMEIKELGLRWKEMVNLDNTIPNNQVSVSMPHPVINSKRIVNSNGKIEALTISVSFDLVLIADVVCEMDDHHDNIGRELMPAISPSQCFEWLVDKRLLIESTWKHREHRLGFQSVIFPMFEMEWYLSVYPSSARNRETPSVHLSLRELPINIAVIWTRCVLEIESLGIRYIVQGVFTENTLEIGWGDDLLPIEDLNECTIRLEMEVVDVYDQKGVNVTNRFVGNGGGDIESNKIEVAVKEWLNGTVGLPQYQEMLEHHGICSLSVVKLLGSNELKEMGVESMGHRLRFLQAIREMEVID